jgi:hypothetical protein
LRVTRTNIGLRGVHWTPIAFWNVKNTGSMSPVGMDYKEYRFHDGLGCEEYRFHDAWNLKNTASMMSCAMMKTDFMTSFSVKNTGSTMNWTVMNVDPSRPVP